MVFLFCKNSVYYELLSICTDLIQRDLKIILILGSFYYHCIKSMQMLVQFSDDEIEYKCYQIETGKFISCKDELGKRLLYPLFLIGDEKVEECVQNILETRDITAQYGIGYQYIPTDICVHALNINNLCISAQYYLLDEFVRMNWKNFQKYIYRIGGITKPSNHSDLILHPIHLIYEKKDTTVYIYRCE